METTQELTYEFVGQNEVQRLSEGPYDDDYIINDPPSGPLNLSQGTKYLGEFDSADSICQAIQTQMAEDRFYPNIWHVNERGTTDLCRIVNA